jgi:hypothetical protein
MSQLVRGATLITASVVGGFDVWGIVVVILALLP